MSINTEYSISGIRLCIEIREALDKHIETLDVYIDNKLGFERGIIDADAFREFPDRLMMSIMRIIDSHKPASEKETIKPKYKCGRSGRSTS